MDHLAARDGVVGVMLDVVRRIWGDPKVETRVETTPARLDVNTRRSGPHAANKSYQFGAVSHVICESEEYIWALSKDHLLILETTSAAIKAPTTIESATIHSLVHSLIIALIIAPSVAAASKTTAVALISCQHLIVSRSGSTYSAHVFETVHQQHSAK